MQSETEVKEQIASGFPVVIGMLVDDGFMEMRGPVVYAGPHGQERGAHALVIVGYDDEVGAFRVINSWGVEWADRGFGWISFEAMRERALEGYVAQDIVVVKPNKGTPTVRVVEEAAVPESPVMDNSGAPIAELGLPVMSHNVVTQRGPAMAIRLPGRIRNARGSSAQVVVRFFGLNGSPLRANIYEYQYRDATGYVAVGTTLFAVDRQTKPLPNVDLVIPYYALNLVPTGGNFEYHLTAEASLYVDGFVVASTPRVPFVVRW